MSAPAYDQGGIVPKRMPASGWPGRPTVDVPGLEQPAHFVHAALTLDDIGHRAILVIASESGEAVTSEQLSALADALDEMYGDEAPEGSRAWLREEMARLRSDRDRLRSECATRQRRAETAEAALRDRSTLDEDGKARERLSLDLSNTHQAFLDRQGRVEALHAEAERLRGELAETQGERDGLQAALQERRDYEDALVRAVNAGDPIPHGPVADTLHNLRGRAEVAERALADARVKRVEIVEALMAEKDAHETTRMAHARVTDQLAHARGERDAQAERAEQAEARYRHERDARQALLAVWKLEVKAGAIRRQAATQAARRRSTATAVAGAATTVLAGLLARRNR